MYINFGTLIIFGIGFAIGWFVSKHKHKYIAPPPPRTLIEEDIDGTHPDNS